MKTASDQPNISVLKSAAEIQQRVHELGAHIKSDYAGKPLVVVGILKGATLFLADLIRAIGLHTLSVDFLGLSSYNGGTESSGIVRITSDLTESIKDTHVLIVEDIIDTGRTVDYLLKNLATRKPASVRVCALLYKPERNEIPVTIDYLGFEIPNVFVVGYGLDYEGRYRNLPYIGVITPEKKL